MEDEASISKMIQEAMNIIRMQAKEYIFNINLKNPEINEIEITFKTATRDIITFLSITEENLSQPYYACTCRVGAQRGFCAHVWVGTMFYFLRGLFDLNDWSYTATPELLKNTIKSLKIYMNSKRTFLSLLN